MASLSENYVIVLCSLIAIAVSILIDIPLSKLFQQKDYYKRNIYRYALTFGNFGFMGNAVVPAVLAQYDPQILYKYLLFTLPLNVGVYTWGIAILIPHGEEKQNPLKNLINPACISIVIGMVLGITGLTKFIPEFVVTTIDYCKACMAPVAMILMGFMIGGFSFKPLLRQYKIYIATDYCASDNYIGSSNTLQSIGFDCGVGALCLCHTARYEHRYFSRGLWGNTKTGAPREIISHTLCVITIPIMFTLLMQFIK